MTRTNDEGTAVHSLQDQNYLDHIVSIRAEARRLALMEAIEIAEDEEGTFTVYGEDRNTRVSQETAREIVARIKRLLDASSLRSAAEKGK